MTSNHNYTTPSKGTQDWNVPINKNFEKIDTDVEIRDSDANKSNYDPKLGAKFLATDSKKVYLGDGNKWNYLATLGGVQGRIYVQSSKPSGKKGDVWIDTS